MSSDIKVVWWGAQRPAHVQRDVVGSTAKTASAPIIIPADGLLHKIEEPSTGQFSATIQAHPRNAVGSIMWIGSNDKYGIGLAPGQMVVIPMFNGTLQARYEPAGRENAGEVTSLKHEADWHFDYAEVT